MLSASLNSSLLLGLDCLYYGATGRSDALPCASHLANPATIVVNPPGVAILWPAPSDDCHTHSKVHRSGASGLSQFAPRPGGMSAPVRFPIASVPVAAGHCPHYRLAQPPLL